jgi:hypothetical protein
VVEAAVSPGRQRSRLLAVWLLLALLVGTIVVIERTDLIGPQPRPESHGGSAAPLLLPVPVEQLGAIEVIHGRAFYRFERDAAGAWFYHAHGVNTGVEKDHRHNADAALAERIAAAFAVFGRTRLERQFTIKTPQDYGVATPELLILVYRPDDLQPLAQYAIGDIAPDTLSRYVLIVGSPAVATVPNYQVDNILALIEAVAGQDAAGRTP